MNDSAVPPYPLGKDPLHALVRPERLWTRAEALGRVSPVPRLGGIYAWYFRDIPPDVPAEGCSIHEGMSLLYVGISPKAPPRNGAEPSGENLRKRIRTHYRGNASASTLRMALGCLLAEELGIALRRVGESARLRFTADGEAALSNWMAENALVCWLEHPQPWLVEHEAIKRLDLPLNLDQNSHHGFHLALSAARAAARESARAQPIVAR